MLYVDEIKMSRKKQNLEPMWEILMKGVELGEPTSFLDHVDLGCTQRECKTSKDIVDNYRGVFQFRMSHGGIEKLPSSEESEANLSSWSYDMEGHAKKCVEKFFVTCKQIDSTVTQSYNFHVFTTINSKKKR